MQKKNLGNLVIAALVVTNIILWVVFRPVNDGTRAHFTRQMIGEVIGSTAMLLIACALFLSTRFRFLEPYFGGLDQMYQSHKRAAMMGMFLLLAHIFTVPLNASQMKPGTPLGVVAFLGLLILVLLTIAPRIPVIGRFTRFAYDKWRRSHRLIGIFFIIGFAHAMLVDPLVRRTTVPFLYLFVLFWVGAISYLYSLFIAKAVRKTYLYMAVAATKLNGTTVEITLKSQGEKLGFAAGQFVFVRVDSDRVLAESHPFTVSSAPHEDNLRISIKASGDWTQYLYDHLKPGMQAKVDGAYGMFNYKTGGKQQIWVAGGIGLTPFLSWIRDFKGQLSDYEIDFYYCMRVPEDALFLEEVEQAAARHRNFRAHVSYSNKDGHLSVDQIVRSSGKPTGKEIYLCGPIAMIQALQKGFAKVGTPASRLHFEEFNFR
jgi:predicted ferric reductase